MSKHEENAYIAAEKRLGDEAFRLTLRCILHQQIELRYCTEAIDLASHKRRKRFERGGALGPLLAELKRDTARIEALRGEVKG